MSEFSLENILLAQELISARVQFDQYQNIVGIRPRSTVFIPITQLPIFDIIWQTIYQSIYLKQLAATRQKDKKHLQKDRAAIVD